MAQRNAHADDAIGADRALLTNYAPATDETTRANADATIKDSPGRDMAMIADMAVVLNDSRRVDDTVAPHLRSDIHCGVMHDDGAGADRRVAGYVCQRRNDGGQLEIEFPQLFEQSAPHLGSTYLADRDDGACTCPGQRRQIVIASDDPIFKHASSDLFSSSDQADDFISAMPLDHINARPCVATGADDEQGPHHQCRPALRPGLLGMLMIRLARLSATGNSMRGQSA